MIVEFAGAPGAGKSFILATDVLPRLSAGGATPVVIGSGMTQDLRLFGRVTRHLPQRFGDPLRWRLLQRRRREHFDAFRSLHPRLVETVELFQTQRPEEAHVQKRDVVRHWQNTCADLSIARANPALDFVADEGLVHRVVQLFTSAVEDVPRDRIEDYCSLIPLPDELIFVDTPLGICMDRLRQRGLWSPWQSFDQLADFVANAHAATTIAVNRIADRGVDVSVVANTGPKSVDS